MNPTQCHTKMSRSKPSVSGTSRTRNRVQLSCDPCFNSKIKCTTTRPICNRCLRIGIECTWENRGKSTAAAGVRCRALRSTRMRGHPTEVDASDDNLQPAPAWPGTMSQYTACLLLARVPVGEGESSRAQTHINRPVGDPLPFPRETSSIVEPKTPGDMLGAEGGIDEGQTTLPYMHSNKNGDTTYYNYNHEYIPAPLDGSDPGRAGTRIGTVQPPMQYHSLPVHAQGHPGLNMYDRGTIEPNGYHPHGPHTQRNGSSGGIPLAQPMEESTRIMEGNNTQAVSYPLHNPAQDLNSLWTQCPEQRPWCDCIHKAGELFKASRHGMIGEAFHVDAVCTVMQMLGCSKCGRGDSRELALMALLAGATLGSSPPPSYASPSTQSATEPSASNQPRAPNAGERVGRLDLLSQVISEVLRIQHTAHEHRRNASEFLEWLQAVSAMTGNRPGAELRHE
ncbi:hypothetical protein GGS20DRAFT_569413 [Poronia punctata]|nr:hypothetical protein GGS20DRAFT_569413 [Poronia punctata]